MGIEEVNKETKKAEEDYIRIPRKTLKWVTGITLSVVATLLLVEPYLTRGIIKYTTKDSEEAKEYRLKNEIYKLTFEIDDFLDNPKNDRTPPIIKKTEARLFEALGEALLSIEAEDPEDKELKEKRYTLLSSEMKKEELEALKKKIEKDTVISSGLDKVGLYEKNMEKDEDYKSILEERIFGTHTFEVKHEEGRYGYYFQVSDVAGNKTKSNIIEVNYIPKEEWKKRMEKEAEEELKKEENEMDKEIEKEIMEKRKQEKVPPKISNLYLSVPVEAILLPPGAGMRPMEVSATIEERPKVYHSGLEKVILYENGKPFRTLKLKNNYSSIVNFKELLGKIGSQYWIEVYDKNGNKSISEKKIFR